MANLPYFVGSIVPSFMSYTPDLHRLEVLSDRITSPGATTHTANSRTVRPRCWPSALAQTSCTLPAVTSA